MGIFIKTEPQVFSPAYNPIIYTVDSDNKAQCNFRYIADLYVNSVFVTSLKLFPFGVNGWASFDFSRILQDYVSYDLQNNVSGFLPNPNSVKRYAVQFGEEFDSSLTCTAGVTEYNNLTYSTTKCVWNGALQYKEFQNYDYLQYIAGSATSKWLSNMPVNTRIKADEKFSLNFLQIHTDTVDYVEILTYDQNMNALGNFGIANPYTIVGADTERNMLTLGAGPANLNSATLSVGTQPVISPDVYFYTVQLFQGGIEFSEKKQFEIDKKCYPFPAKRLWWLNRLGGFDSYDFKMKAQRTLAIGRTEYNKKFGGVEVNSPDILYRYDIGDRGRTTLTVDATENYNYTTDWLTEAEGLWIEELFTSPEVYEASPITGYEITGATCFSVPGEEYDITGAAHNLDGTAYIYINEMVPGSLAPSTVFDYVVGDGSPIGMADTGTGKLILGYDGILGAYETNIVSTINAGALITGTMYVGGIPAPTMALVLPVGVVLPVGTYFQYSLPGAGVFGAAESGFGTVTDFDGTQHITDIPCTDIVGSLVTGILYDFGYDMKLTPLIIASTAWEEKRKYSISNIQYSIDLSAAQKINVQRN